MGLDRLRPEQTIGDNDFGNPMIKDQSGRYWRPCPEDQYCSWSRCQKKLARVR